MSKLSEEEIDSIRREILRKTADLKEEAKKRHPAIVKEALRNYSEKIKAKYDILLLCEKRLDEEGA